MKFLKGMVINALILSAAAAAALYLSSGGEKSLGEGKPPRKTPAELERQAEDAVSMRVPALMHPTAQEELKRSIGLSIAGESARDFFGRCAQSADPSTMTLLASEMSGGAVLQLTPDGGRTEIFADSQVFRERLALYVNAERAMSIGLLGVHTTTAKSLGLSPMVLTDACMNARAASMWLAEIYRQYLRAQPGTDRDALVRAAIDQYKKENMAAMPTFSSSEFKRSESLEEAQPAEPRSVTLSARGGDAAITRAQESGTRKPGGEKSPASQNGLIF